MVLRRSEDVLSEPLGFSCLRCKTKLKGILPVGMRGVLATVLGVRQRRLLARIAELESQLSYSITLEYPTSSANSPRWTSACPNRSIQGVLQAHESVYRAWLVRFPKYFHLLRRIPVTASNENQPEPSYINGAFPGLDSVTLYCMLAELRPHTLIEVGSGYSTKFARRSIIDNNLQTTLFSIDPHPRVNIDSLCDEIIRAPLEQVDLAIFDCLIGNDIIFIDSSHRCFMNSDVTVLFLEIMPRLHKGVFVHFHDIFWPLDYPEEWAKRYFNEQYLLGTILAHGAQSFTVELPNAYVSQTPTMRGIIDPLWDSDPRFSSVERHGGSFWIQKA